MDVFFHQIHFTGDSVYVESSEGFLRLAKIEKIWKNERYVQSHTSSLKGAGVAVI